MYESFFMLSRRPFAPAPQAEAYLPLGPLEQARQTLVRCLERGEGPGLVVGPAGTGKSLLCHVLARQFRGRLQVALLSSARVCTRRALLQHILFELKLPYRDMDEGELRLSLVDHLEPRSGGPEGLLLLVDEAHTLPLRLLEEIRLLTNVVRDGQSRVRLLLAGNMALEERLANPKLESFHQRVAARCYLQPLTREETLQYIQAQIRWAGGVPESLLTGAAQAAVHTATDGIPRLVNQLCDHALLLGSLNGTRQIDASLIEEAWADLQQLPVPLHDPPVLPRREGAESPGIVEFGQLHDEPEPGRAASSPAVAAQAAATLDTIHDQLASLNGEAPPVAAREPEFTPTTGNGTEVELIFHAAHDPFGGDWEEEEVVLDRYATLEDAQLRSRHRVQSAEGRSLGAAIAQALESSAPGDRSRSEEPSGAPLAQLHLAVPAYDLPDSWSVETGPWEPPATIDAAADFHPASDPLLPEESAVRSAARRPAISLRQLAQDDRDMIVVEDEEPARTEMPAARTRRPEYRRLFSSLRNT
jgi:type II secretory pathway predicted ATPase ExeA